MIILLSLLACGDHETAESTTGQDTGPAETVRCDASWDAWASGFFTTYCGACHSQSSPDRYGAPDGIDFDTIEMVQAWSGRIHERVLVDETMPMGGGVPSDALDRLAVWMDCQAVQP